MGSDGGRREIAFDPDDSAFIADPYPRYRELRERDEVLRDQNGLWVLTRHADVAGVLRDQRWSSDPSHMSAARAQRREANFLVGQDGPKIMLLADPPDHTRLRRLANRAFTPRAVEALRPWIEARVEELIETAARHDRVDFMALVAQPLPVLVICELLGVPPADRHQFHPWSSAIARVLDPVVDPSLVQAAIPAAMGFVSYFNALMDQRRSQPGADLLSSLIQAEAEGESLDVRELFAMVILLFIAGHETTTNLLGNGLLALLENPDQADALRKDPELAGPAVEELLRYDAPVQVTARTATEDLEVAGVRVPRGHGVVCALAAANRDPAYVEEPERLLLHRGRSSHLAFGHGIHHCLGAPLARLEAQIALPRFVAAFPDLELAEAPSYREHFVLRGLSRLAVATGGRRG